MRSGSSSSTCSGVFVTPPCVPVHNTSSVPVSVPMPTATPLLPKTIPPVAPESKFDQLDEENFVELLKYGDGGDLV